MGNESFLSGLFDVNFQKYTTRSFLRVLYIIAMIVIGLYMVFSLISTWTSLSIFEFSAYSQGSSQGANNVEYSFSTGDSVPGKLISTLITIVQSNANLAVIRISLEVFAALTNTAAAWSRIKQRGMSV